VRYTAGIDIGSGNTKAVILGERERGAAPTILGTAQTKSGVQMEKAALRALGEALTNAGLDQSKIDYVATTGFGRYALPSRDIQITEITSGAKGANFYFPGITSVLDIGAQSTRAILTDKKGKVRTFKTNAKCAAGSGSFIARAAKYLLVKLEEVGDLALDAENPQPISSVCAVLAESEIINHVSTGASTEDILRGIYDSLADRSAALLRRVQLGDELVFIGGVARQRGMVKALEDRLGIHVRVPEECEYVCAVGAGVLGFKRLDQREAQMAAEQAATA